MNTLVHSALTSEKNSNLVKDSYQLINSATIAERFKLQGWDVFESKQNRVKSIERDGYQKHLIKFRNESFKNIQGLKGHHESIPELIIENSHDGTAALKIFFGVFRIACLNGLIAGSNFSSFRVIHSKNSVLRLDESIDGMTAAIPELIKRVEYFSTIELDREKSVELARRAAELRLKHTQNIYSIDHESMLNPVRYSDQSSDAYSVFNVIQEKIIRGGIQFIQKNEFDHFERKKTRAINSVSQSVKLNRELWNIFESLVA